ncbi:hypothetical protein BASA60_000936 [Batrachochytrium salamandrivorans]|nr:hypothetical protein BASA62_008830 [Batrachochytrium salamandrivorans]KAH6584535.1 hypothetical protein BASA60_000936 [Batrachochytrium salamandrivorans]KAH9274155.1 YjeF family domain-containing protein [Batrachochytrium salamandrivorans]
MFKQIVPPMNSSLYKGQAGRVGVVGGSLEYTGAPYFAAMAALRTGVDLCHVFCAQESGQVIKGFSPELIVHALLVTEKDCTHLDEEATNARIDGIVDLLTPVLQRLDSLIVGPGLSRDPVMQETAKRIIQHAVSINTPLVVDADGLRLIEQHHSLVMGYKNVVLTPNINELKRLYVSRGIDYSGNIEESVAQLSKALGFSTILCKGPSDIVVTGDEIRIVLDNASLRRCGGQGDVLAGVLGAFLAWTNGFIHGRWTTSENSADLKQALSTAPLLAAYNASYFTRNCSAEAFRKHHRSTLTSDILKEIGPMFHKLYD